ncbi:MAG: hypothetical protein IPI67_17905 [Myxococcales bacterium]|nr:hypothetical protein [Myxococcales bacterium]
MWLEQDAVDLLQVDGFGAVAHGFEQGAEAEVSGAAQDALGRADDEAERVVSEGRVGERHLVELGADEVGHAVGCELLHQDRVGDAVLDVFVDGEAQAAEQLGLGDQDQAVILGEVFEEQPDPAQRGDVHQVRVVDDGREHLAAMR